MGVRRDYDPVALAHALALNEQQRREDPLRYFKCMSWAQERYIVELFAGREVYAHAGNSGGKTAVGIWCDLAPCRGIEEVRGYYLDCGKCGAQSDPRDKHEKCVRCGGELRERRLKIPRFEPPVTWGLGGPTYKLMAVSSLPMIRALLGSWPYQEIRQGNRNTVVTFVIKHERSTGTEPDETWSQLFVFPYDGERPEAARLDGFHCDEPPPPDFLNAFRTRKKATRRLYRGITATPLKRLEWEPILSQFPAELLKVEGGKVRMQWSVYDNTALTPEDLRQIEENMGGMSPEERRARLMGDHTDMGSGSCPFDAGTLDEMEAGCREPKREALRVERETDTSSGRRLQVVSFDLETWFDFEPGDVYFMTADTGKGIKDGKHDPDCFHVWSRRKKALCARVNEYLGGYGLGQAMALVGRRYGYCEADPAVTGGYGESVLSGLRQAGYQHIAHNQRHDRPGRWMQRLGFHESPTSNAEWFGAMESALKTRGVTILSRDVVRCLKDLIKDETGKILGGPGYHDEDWVCAGRAVYKLGFGSADGPRVMAPQPGTIGGLLDMVRRSRRQAVGVPERW